MCNNVLDLERIADLEFGTIITWLELKKGQEEIENIVSEQYKNKIRK